MKNLFKKALLAGILSLGFSSMGLAEEPICLMQDKDRASYCHNICEEIYGISERDLGRCKILGINKISSIFRVHRELERPGDYEQLAEKISVRRFLAYIQVSTLPFINTIEKNYDEEDAQQVLAWITLNIDVLNAIQIVDPSGTILNSLAEASW